MKFVYQGDIHLRDRAPVNRIDNYREVQFDKLEQLVGFANDNEATLLLGGDIFDSYKVSAEIVNRANEIFLTCNRDIFAVMGQHDVPYHDMDVIKSPIRSLQLSGALTVENNCLAIIDGEAIHFCGWGEEMPVVILPQVTNILLGHISVFNVVPHYWKGEGYTPDTLRKKYPGFDYYLCGDIHDNLHDDNVIVSGSMMRSSINQENFNPRAYLIDTTSKTVEPLFYTVSEGVFNAVEKKGAEDLELGNLVDALKNATVGKRTYKRDCLSLAAKDKPVRDIIEEILDDVD